MALGIVAASAGLGFITTSVFNNMADNAGQVIRVTGVETRETVRTAGHEARATIEKADRAAQSIIGTMNSKFNDSVTHARRNAEQIVQTTAIEGRETAAHFRLQAQEFLRMASAESNLLLTKLGNETRDTIRTGNKAFQETGLLLSSEINHQIRTTSTEAQTVLQRGGDQVARIIEELSNLTVNTRAEYEAFATRLLREMTGSLNQTFENLGTLCKDFTTHLTNEAKGLILNFGNQGRLLIRDTGREFRITADKILTDFFVGQELVIAEAGYEARLAIQEVGKEVRSTLYEIPYIAGKTGEHLSRGISFGFMDQCYGLKDIDKRIHNLQAYFARESANIEQAVRYVYMQDDLPAHIKFQLYKALVDIVNIPENADAMQKILIFIGVMALRDRSLKYRSIWGIWKQHYGETLVDRIPGQAKALLKQHRENTLWKVYPPQVVDMAESVAQIADNRELEAQIDAKELALAQLRRELELERGRNQLLQLEASQERGNVGSANDQLRRLQQEHEALVDLLTRQHHAKVQSLEETNNRLRIELERLANAASGE